MYEPKSVEMVFQTGVGETEQTGILKPDAYQISELTDIISIKCGEDHFLALDSHGACYAMGNDKYGQCGQFRDNRPIIPPFREARIGKPMKINCTEKFVKIACGHRHSFGVTNYGRLYAWGYNHQVQISHGEDMASSQTQKHVIFEPLTITKEIESHKVTHVDGGSDFSIIIRGGRYYFN